MSDNDFIRKDQEPLIRPYILDACGMCRREIDPKGDDFIGITLRANNVDEPVSPEMGLCKTCGSSIFTFMQRAAVAAGLAVPRGDRSMRDEIKEAFDECNRLRLGGQSVE